MEQITKDLWIGGITSSAAVKYNKIKLVIGLIDETYPYKVDLHPIIDGYRGNDPEKFIEILKVIDNAIKNRRTPVFLNCGAGMSRSPIMCALYLYYSSKGNGKYANFDDALEFVLSKSTVAKPNPKLIIFVREKVVPLINADQKP